MHLLPRASKVAVVSGGRQLPSSASAIIYNGRSEWNNSGHDSDDARWHRCRKQQSPEPNRHVTNWRSLSTTTASSHTPFSNRDSIYHHRSSVQIGLQDAGGGLMENPIQRITNVLTTALQNGMHLFDIPPSFEKYKNIKVGEGGVNSLSSSSSSSSSKSVQSSSVGVGGGVGSKCWQANRKSEVLTASALQLALDAPRSKEEEFKDDEIRMNNDKEEEGNNIITLTCRLGYRSAIAKNYINITLADETNDAISTTSIDINDNINLDLQEQEGKFVGDAQVGIIFAGEERSNSIDKTDSTFSQPSVAIVHNLSSEYVLHSLRTSPLVRWRQRQQTLSSSPSSSSSSMLKKNSEIRLISLAHNPETQMASYLIQQQQHGANNVNNSTLQNQAHFYMKQSLTSAFIGYEIAVKEDLIDGYGVDSNGLSLPSHHNMHLCWRDVLECAVDAYMQVHGDGISTADDADGSINTRRSSLRILRLPGNLLETRGLQVAGEIRTFFTNSSAVDMDGDANDYADDDRRGSRTLRKLQRHQHMLPTSVDVYVTRPTTVFPHGGGGAESNFRNDGATHGKNVKHVDARHPVLLQDYQLIDDAEESLSSINVGANPTNATTSSSTPLMIWTNEYYNKYGLRPTTYQSILNATLSHFDADSILEASQSRTLTVEERETLDGCKLLRDMIHDLDTNVDDLRSFAAYEEFLMNVVVPLIHGSFEGLDEESASRLQDFLRVHGLAARLAVARWTREMLLAGWRRSSRRNLDPKINGESAEVDDDFGWEKNTDEEKKILQVWTSLGFGNGNNRSQYFGYKIPEENTLQEFAVRRLLENDTLSGMVLDCSSPEHVLEAIKAMKNVH